MAGRINLIEVIIKNIDVNLVKIQSIGDMSSLELLLVDDEMVEVLKYCTQMLKIIEQKYGAMLRD